MYAPGGVAYVYKCYGIHTMMNVSLQRRDEPHAALLRSIVPLSGVRAMIKARKIKTEKQTFNSIAKIGAGPGCLTQALGIEMTDNGVDMTSSDRMWITKCPSADGILGMSQTDEKLKSQLLKLFGTAVSCGPRIGIWGSGSAVDLPYRYFYERHMSVSRPNSVHVKLKPPPTKKRRKEEQEGEGDNEGSIGTPPNDIGTSKNPPNDIGTSKNPPNDIGTFPLDRGLAGGTTNTLVHLDGLIYTADRPPIAP
eukprot:GHVO01039258.1.p1 GENE.GHVO01039258.1~~GHVO01039258.1.p1  ORF type:complete len:251 (+),score=59.12 GHVO01039258.1:119-871(+)